MKIPNLVKKGLDAYAPKLGIFLANLRRDRLINGNLILLVDPTASRSDVTLL